MTPAEIRERWSDPERTDEERHRRLGRALWSEDDWPWQGVDEVGCIYNRLPDFSDPRAMMEVVERMEAKGFGWTFTTTADGARHARFTSWDEGRQSAGAYAPTLMESVALAALIASQALSEAP